MPKVNCSLCGTQVEGRTLASPQKLENRILDLIRADRPDWEAKRGICGNCLEQYRAKKFISYIEAEYQKMSELEHAVVSKITRRDRVNVPARCSQSPDSRVRCRAPYLCGDQCGHTIWLLSDRRARRAQ